MVVDPGPGNRLLFDREVVRRDDEWTVTTHAGWGQARPTDVGLTVADARKQHSFGNGAQIFYRREVKQLALCGCGNHDVDAMDDPYDQHNGWVAEQADGDAQ